MHQEIKQFTWAISKVILVWFLFGITLASLYNVDLVRERLGSISFHASRPVNTG